MNAVEYGGVIKLLRSIDITKHEEDARVRDQNCKNICSIIKHANSAPANLRFGDRSTNRAISNRLDPMGGLDKKLTKKESSLLEIYGYGRKLANKFPVLETYPYIVQRQPFIVSSTGLKSTEYDKENRYIVEKGTSFDDYINSFLKSLSHQL